MDSLLKAKPALLPKNLLAQKSLLIAGPCSAETETQVIETAEALAATGRVNLLRAGVWKPRTAPGGFEGAGVKALHWLREARKITGLPFAVEVATSRHVEDALAFETDVVWIGARTAVNPFSVQQIAEALRGSGITVLVKNPVNPDLKLWAGAVERLLKCGTENIGLIHRGFSSFRPTHYRNAPLWELAIEMKRLFPALPLIGDPSHICGRRDSLAEVAQQCLDLGYEGLMMEVHPQPDAAWTDSAQQLTPEGWLQLIEGLCWKSEDSSQPAYRARLSDLRKGVDALDDELLGLLAERMRLVKQIGRLKKENGVTVLQRSRWSEVLNRALRNGEALGLDENFTGAYMKLIHLESIRLQEK